jgi:excisionase family DNA binding protein
MRGRLSCLIQAGEFMCERAGHAGIFCRSPAVFAILCDERARSMPDEILTLPEVAQLLKVAEKTVYTMAQKSQLPAFKVGGQWRFQRVDIDRWIEQQKANSREEGRS